MVHRFFSLSFPVVEALGGHNLWALHGGCDCFRATWRSSKGKLGCFLFGESRVGLYSLGEFDVTCGSLWFIAGGKHYLYIYIYTVFFYVYEDHGPKNIMFVTQS